jgi:hypothetical protein
MSAVPSEFTCPITFDIMVDPVMGDDGHTYERAAILESLSRDMRSPMTRAYMSPTSLRPNYALKSQIERYHLSNSTVTTAPKPFVSQPLILSALLCGDGALNVTLAPPATGVRQPIVMLLALDNSGSMGENASVDTNETGGLAFTRMDLCKHTIRTVAGMLHDDDMLGLVSFSTTAKVVLKPIFMTTDGKARLESALSTVRPDSQTNIWAGLETIHRLATAPELANSHIVAALLTDGLPNVNPPRGIVETYKTLANKSYTMSTFGFGYSLDSNLLDAIATEGKGSFGFIPDYSMVATVFINWAATALATVAKNQTVELRHNDGTITVFPSGEIQSGQARVITIQSSKPVTLVSSGALSVEPTAAPSANPEFFAGRKDILDAIKACIQSNGTVAHFRTVYDTYSATTDVKLKELLRDIQPTAEEGQVAMAPRFYEKWGKHYLRAYLRAQEMEQCMNFKDPGLQIYGGDLFHAIQAEGEATFSSLPALEPSGASARTSAYSPSPTVGASVAPIAAAPVPAPVNMAQYFYNSGGGCFHGSCNVLMANGVRKPIHWLRRGDHVWTPTGTAMVRALVVCNTRQETQSLCKIGTLRITPWHPILVDGAWIFPSDISPVEHVPLKTVYNVLLDEGHILDVEETLCVTLAHNFKESVVEHEFFGTDRIVENLKKAAGWDIGLPTYQNLGAYRNSETGRIIGWYDA